VAVLWPIVRDRLVTILPTLPGFGAVTVYDGPVTSGDTPATYVTVGWQPRTEDESAGSFTQLEGPDGFSVTEDGAVLMEFAAVTGDSTVPDAFAMYGALATWLQQNPRLGILVPGSLASLQVEVAEAQNTAGAVQRLLVGLLYTAHSA